LAGASELQQGSIIWIDATDPRGQNIKKRGFVILNQTAAIQAGHPLICVAITGTYREPPDPMLVPMRWNPQGTTETGLTKKCFAKCDWVRVVPASKTEGSIEYDGICQGKRVKKIDVLKILERVEVHRNKQKH